MLFVKAPEGSAKELYGKLCAADFDSGALRKELEAGKYDAEAVNLAALEYADACAFDVDQGDNTWDQYAPGETVPGRGSSHLAEAVGLLLDFGLDPNRIFRAEDGCGGFNEYNIMDKVLGVYNGYEAADALYLMLERGGDPNLMIGSDELSTEIDYDMGSDTLSRKDGVSGLMYGAKVHCWFVLVGFRAERGQENLEMLVQPVDGFNLANLKNHRQYYAGAVHSDRTEEGWDLVVFDRKTNWEVARY